MVREHGLPIARACRAARLSRAAYYRQGVNWASRDAPVVDALNAVVEKRQRWGFWKCFDPLHDQSHGWNHKRVHRVYCKLRLNLPRRVKRRLPARVRQPLAAPAVANAVWALDFMSDCLYDGRRFRTLNVLDEGVREALAIELRYIQPGKPDQNAYIERFNRTYREEVLNAYVFEDVDQVREISVEWIQIYNEERPHEALESMPPARFRAMIESNTTSTSKLST